MKHRNLKIGLRLIALFSSFALAGTAQETFGGGRRAEQPVAW
jgi:hypothetical protein